MSTTDNTHTALLAALKAIVNECMDYPPELRYSHDSYLPEHLLKAAQQAIELAEEAEAKRFATLKAQFALAGHTLHQSGPGDGPGPGQLPGRTLGHGALSAHAGRRRAIPDSSGRRAMIAMSNTLEEFRQAITATLGCAPDDILDDGAIHRFIPSGRGSDKPAWYMLHLDGIPAGAFGDWRSGLQSTWCAKSDNAMTPAELADHRQRVKAMKAQREADTLATQLQASVSALQRWNSATHCTQHGYLTTKGVKGHGLKVEADGFLIVPMRDTAGKLWNIERINPADSKDKRGLYGGRRTGLYHSIGKPGWPSDRL